MPDSNTEQTGLPEQSPAPTRGDFNADLRAAQASGNYENVIETAKKSHRMLIAFREAVARGEYAGKECEAVAMGLGFLDNFIGQAAAQVQALKQAEKQAPGAVARG